MNRGRKESIPGILAAWIEWFSQFNGSTKNGKKRVRGLRAIYRETSGWGGG